MAYTFTPPTYESGIGTGSMLLKRYKLTTGYTVLKTGSTYTTVSYPSQTQISAADIAYLGGHIYSITDSEAAELIAAGYTPEAV